MLFITDEQKRELIDSVNMLELVDSLGIECKKVGSHYSILCPCSSHSDKSYGNCFVYPGNVYCFGCGRSFDAVGLVCETKGVNTYDAICYLADLMNRSDEYEQKGVKHIKSFHSYPKLDTDALQCLGLGLETKECYCPIGLSDQRDKNCRRDMDNLFFRYNSLKKPKLSHLKEDEPEVFHWLVQNKACEQIEKLDHLIFALSNDNSFTNQLSIFLDSVGCSVQELIEQLYKEKELVIKKLFVLLN